MWSSEAPLGGQWKDFALYSRGDRGPLDALSAAWPEPTQGARRPWRQEGLKNSEAGQEAAASMQGRRTRDGVCRLVRLRTRRKAGTAGLRADWLCADRAHRLCTGRRCWH